MPDSNTPLPASAVEPDRNLAMRLYHYTTPAQAAAILRGGFFPATEPGYVTFSDDPSHPGTRVQVEVPADLATPLTPTPDPNGETRYAIPAPALRPEYIRCATAPMAPLAMPEEMRKITRQHQHLPGIPDSREQLQARVR